MQWLYEAIANIVEYFAEALLNVLNMNLSYFETTVPITKDIVSIMMVTGLALLIGNLVFQAMKTMASGMGFEGEDPRMLAGRSIVMLFLLLGSRQVCAIGLGLSQTVVDMLMIPSAIQFPQASESMFDVAGDSSWLLCLIVGLVLIFQIVKIFFQIGERYVIMVALTILSPLAFAMGGSKNTLDIFKGWVRMQASMCLMMILSVVFLKLLISAMGFMPSGPEVIPWLILIVGISKTGKQMDNIITKIGLNPAFAGDPLRSRLPGVLSMMVFRGMAGKVGKSFSSGASGNKTSGGSSLKPSGAAGRTRKIFSGFSGTSKRAATGGFVPSSAPAPALPGSASGASVPPLPSLAGSGVTAHTSPKIGASGTSVGGSAYSAPPLRGRGKGGSPISGSEHGPARGPASASSLSEKDGKRSLTGVRDSRTRGGIKDTASSPIGSDKTSAPENYKGRKESSLPSYGKTGSTLRERGSTRPSLSSGMTAAERTMATAPGFSAAPATTDKTSGTPPIGKGKSGDRSVFARAKVSSRPSFSSGITEKDKTTARTPGTMEKLPVSTVGSARYGKTVASVKPRGAPTVSAASVITGKPASGVLAGSKTASSAGAAKAPEYKSGMMVKPGYNKTHAASSLKHGSNNPGIAVASSGKTDLAHTQIGKPSGNAAVSSKHNVTAPTISNRPKNTTGKVESKTASAIKPGNSTSTDNPKRHPAVTGASISAGKPITPVSSAGKSTNSALSGAKQAVAPRAKAHGKSAGLPTDKLRVSTPPNKTASAEQAAAGKDGSFQTTALHQAHGRSGSVPYERSHGSSGRTSSASSAASIGSGDLSRRRHASSAAHIAANTRRLPHGANSRSASGLPLNTRPSNVAANIKTGASHDDRGPALIREINGKSTETNHAGGPNNSNQGGKPISSTDMAARSHLLYGINSRNARPPIHPDAKTQKDERKRQSSPTADGSLNFSNMKTSVPSDNKPQSGTIVRSPYTFPVNNNGNHAKGNNVVNPGYKGRNGSKIAPVTETSRPTISRRDNENIVGKPA